MISNIFHFLPGLLAQLAGESDEDAPPPADAGVEGADHFIPAAEDASAPALVHEKQKILPEMKAVSLATLQEIFDPREKIWLFVGSLSELKNKVQDGSMSIPKDIPLYFLDARAQASLATIVLRKLKAETKTEGISFLLEPKTPNQKSFDAFQSLGLQNLTLFYEHLEKDGLLLFVGSEGQLKKAIKRGNIGVAKHYYHINPKQQGSLFSIVRKRIGLPEGTPKVHNLTSRVLETPRRFEEFGLAQLGLLRTKSDDDVYVFVGSSDDLRIYQDQIFERASAKSQFYFLNSNKQSALTQILGTKFTDIFPHYSSSHPSQYLRPSHGTLFVQTALGSGMPLARKYTPELHDEIVTPQVGTTAVILLVNQLADKELTDALFLLQQRLSYSDALYYVVDKNADAEIFNELKKLHVLNKTPQQNEGFVLIRDNKGGAVQVVVPEVTDLRGNKLDEEKLPPKQIHPHKALNARNIKEHIDKGTPFVLLSSSDQKDEMLARLQPKAAEEIPYLLLDKAGKKLAERYKLPQLPPAAKAVLLKPTFRNGIQIAESLAFSDAEMVKKHARSADANGYLHMDESALKSFLAHHNREGEIHYVLFGNAASQDYLDMLAANKDEHALYGNHGRERNYIWYYGSKASLKSFDPSLRLPQKTSFQVQFSRVPSGEWQVSEYSPFRFIHIKSMKEANEYIHSGETTPSLVLSGNGKNLKRERMQVLINALIERFHKTGEKVKPVIVLMDEAFVKKNYGSSGTDRWKEFAKLVQQSRGEVNGYWFQREEFIKGPFDKAALVDEKDLTETDEGKRKAVPSSDLSSVKTPEAKVSFSEVIRKNVEMFDEISIQGSILITDIKNIGKMILISGDAQDEEVQLWLETIAKRKAANKAETHVFFYNGDLTKSGVAQHFVMKDPHDPAMLTKMEEGSQIMACSPSAGGDFWECVPKK